MTGHESRFCAEMISLPVVWLLHEMETRRQGARWRRRNKLVAHSAYRTLLIDCYAAKVPQEIAPSRNTTGSRQSSWLIGRATRNRT